MGSIGMPEILIVAVICCLIFGPRQLPKLGKALGETIKEFRSIGKTLKETGDGIEAEVIGVKHSIEKDLNEVKRDLEV